MFWLFLGKSALKKSGFAKMAMWIIVAIPLLFLMLAALSCVAILSTISNPVEIVAEAVGVVGTPNIRMK